MSLFRRFFGQSAPTPATALPRLSAETRPPLVYAIGDVHGCLEQLLALEARIVADAAGESGEKWLVMLGDYVDRGPASAQVLDHLSARPPAGFKRVCLRGNHEQAMLGALEDGAAIESWLSFGGDATLASYGLSSAEISSLSARGRPSQKLQLLQASIPDEHVGFLRGLPGLLSLPGYVFVHAGLRPGVPLGRQSDRDLLWIRREFLDAGHDFGSLVIHGHTPVDQPYFSAHRIDIDTGCYASGRLTGVRVDDDGVRVV